MISHSGNVCVCVCDLSMNCLCESVVPEFVFTKDPYLSQIVIVLLQ